MPRMSWKEKGLLVLLITLFLPGAVLSDMQALLRWFGTGIDDVIVEFIPSTFRATEGTITALRSGGISPHSLVSTLGVPETTTTRCPPSAGT